ncbi:hypothetical protein LUZ60_012902 [Juncus effusus]|nr:hypothetical protein LUZ60_012902 [Juncus effusus]
MKKSGPFLISREFIPRVYNTTPQFPFLSFPPAQNPNKLDTMAGASPLEACWAAEYVLRRRDIPTGVFKSLILSLPKLPPSSLYPPSLRRLIILHHLSSSRSISSQTLCSIEHLYYLNPNRNSYPNPLASDAYLAVAVHLAYSAKDFPNAVGILFTQRISDIIGSPEAAGLVSDRMKEAKKEMEKAAMDLKLRERVLRKERMDVHEAIRVFVDKEWEETEKNPSFVEIAADAAAGVPGSETAWMKAVEKERPIILQFKKARQLTNPTGGHIGESNRTSTTELDKISKTLESSLQDPLPDATKITSQLPQVYNKDKGKTVNSDPIPDAIKTAGQQAQMEAPVNNKDKGKTVISDLIPDAIKVVSQQAQTEAPVNNKDKGKTVISDCGKGASKGGNKRSLMDHNQTAFTYEWNDSIESDLEPRRKTRQRRPSPKTRAASSSPNLMQNNREIRVRRKNKKFSAEEEDTLRQAVKEYGVGNWKAILDSYREIFEDRTDVDLKDKWRNMTKG